MENRSVMLYVCIVESDFDPPKLVGTPALSTKDSYVLGWDPNNFEVGRAFNNYRIVSKPEAHSRGYRETKKEAMDSAFQYIADRIDLLLKMSRSYEQKKKELHDLYRAVED